jgi:hypothetical protein
VGLKPNIELNIEELVLHGFPSDYRHRIGDALERELTRLLAEQGLRVPLAHNQELASLDAGTFSLAPTAKASVIGVEVARAVYGGLGEYGGQG